MQSVRINQLRILYKLNSLYLVATLLSISTVFILLNTNVASAASLSSPQYMGGADSSGTANSGTSSTALGNDITEREVYVDGDVMYVSTGTSSNSDCATVRTGCELQIYNVANRAAPTLIAGIDASGTVNGGTETGSIYYSITVQGDYLYLGSDGSGTDCASSATKIGCEIKIYNISSPATPTFVAGIDASGGINSGIAYGATYSVFVEGSNLYAGNAGNSTNCNNVATKIGCEIKIYNISSPASPTFVAGIDASGGINSGAIYGSAKVVYINSGKLYVGSYMDSTDCGDVANKVGCETKIYDISTPSSPVYLTGIDTSGAINGGTSNGVSINSLDVSGNYLYIGQMPSVTNCGDGSTKVGCEIQIYNITNPYAPTFASGIDISSTINTGTTGNNPYNSVLIKGNYLYAAKGGQPATCNASGLRTPCELFIYDISDPTAPVNINVIDSSGTVGGGGTGGAGFRSIWMDDDYLYVATSGSATNCNDVSTKVGCELQIYAIDDTTPVLTSDPISALSINSATINGTITGQGGSSITRRGFVWGSSSQNPGTNSPESSGYSNVVDDPTQSIGAFNKAITSLNENSTYYFRAFATNSQGITYGDEVSFKALKNPILSSPTENTINKTIDVDLTIYSPVKSGSLKLEFTGNSTTTLTLNNLAPGNHTFTIDPSNPTATSQVASSSTVSIADDTYSVTLRHYDAGNFAELSDSTSGITIDTINPLLQSTIPVDNENSTSISGVLTMNFDELIIPVSGNLVIYRASDDQAVQTIDLTTQAIDDYTIEIGYSGLDYDEDYYVQFNGNSIEDLAGNSTAGISNKTSWNFTTMSDPDIDSDGISTAVENTAPNNGDGNNDGTLDSTQANVASLIDSINNKYATLEVSDDCSISSVAIAGESINSVQDPAYNYSDGLWSFEADCSTPGYTATVKIYYYDITPENKILRKYNPVTNAYHTISDANITTQTIAGHSVAAATYVVTDGGERDIDGMANGIIKDPVGLATATVGAPNTGL